MIKIYKHLFLLILFLICIFFNPLENFAAEIIQVRNSTLIIIGDNNRTYPIKLSCVYVDQSDEEAAFNWVKSELPRKKKINLLPRSSKDGIISANLLTIEENVDINAQMIMQGLATKDC